MWRHFVSAKAAYRAALPIAAGECAGMVALLLAGGTEFDEMPKGLATACSDFEAMPPERVAACRNVTTPLIAAALECSRKPLFCDELKRLMKCMKPGAVCM